MAKIKPINLIGLLVIISVVLACIYVAVFLITSSNRQNQADAVPSEASGNRRQVRSLALDPALIGTPEELGGETIDTADWREFSLKGYDFKFRYPGDWHYGLKNYANGEVVTFYNPEGGFEMDFKAPTDRHIDDCVLVKTERTYFLNTNDPETVLFLEIADGQYYNGYNKQAVLYWKKSWGEENWKGHPCFEYADNNNNGSILIEFNGNNKETQLGTLYHIAKSFTFLDDSAKAALEFTDRYAEISQRSKTALLENPDKYLGNMGYMKLVDILPVRPRAISIFEGVDMNVSLVFENAIIIEGTYDYDPHSYYGDKVCFTITSTSSLEKIPYFKGGNYDGARVFCFSNQEKAQEVFGPAVSHGEAKIEIDRVVVNYYPTGLINYMDLVRVLEKN